MFSACGKGWQGETVFGYACLFWRKFFVYFCKKKNEKQTNDEKSKTNFSQGLAKTPFFLYNREEGSHDINRLNGKQKGRPYASRRKKSARRKPYVHGCLLLYDKEI